MVGFSSLIEHDETGTLERQKEHRHTLIEPTFGRLNGRIIKLTGDGLIAEFNSVVEAMQAALHVQKEIVSREASLPEGRRIRYRMAIHLGDIVLDEGDIYGDGVNIAARLEALADPGGIVVSGTAHDVLKSQVEVDYRSLGTKKLKNIARPVRVFQVVRPGVRSSRWTTRTLVIMVSIIALVGILAAGAAWMRSDFAQVDPDEMALELPNEPSIAVLPFAMRGDSPDQNWIADAITESTIATLSFAPDMVVIAYSTMSGYGERDVTPAQAARELGVRYVLTGSVLPTGDQLRVTAELADVVDGTQIWSIQKDLSTDDLIAVQDEIARSVFEELSVSLTVGEATRSWIEYVGGFENYVTMIKGRAEFQKFSPEGHAKAERIWRQFYEDNPDLAFTNYLMGYLYWQKPVIGISTDPARDRATALRFAQRALEIEEFGDAYTLAALLTLSPNSYDEAIALADKAVALSPGSADANALAGLVKSTAGQAREGLELMERGMRLEPDFPGWLPEPINFARMELGRFDEAKQLAEQVLASDINDVRAKPDAAAALTAIAVFEGDMAEARARADKLLELYPAASAAWARQQRAGYKDRSFTEKYVDALIKAGIPES